jgi:hypothetical protein
LVRQWIKQFRIGEKQAAISTTRDQYLAIAQKSGGMEGAIVKGADIAPDSCCRII